MYRIKKPINLSRVMFRQRPAKISKRRGACGFSCGKWRSPHTN